MGDDTISVRLTKKELWELMNGFGASFESGAEGNELAEQVSRKLDAAFRKLAARLPDGGADHG